jgi:PE family
MSFVSVTPDVVGQAAGELDNIGSALSAANAAAASTTGIVAPGADAVSAAVAALLGAHAEEYQAVGAQAADFHSQFVSLLNAGTGSYVSAELANARTTAASGLGGLGGGSGGVLSYLTGSIPGVSELELAVVAAGPAVAALPVLERQTGFVSALQTGNLGAATSALRSPVVQQAALHGQQTVSVQLPGSVAGVQNVALNVPFGGVLAPVQPVTVSVTSNGSPPITVPIPGLETGGLIPWLRADGPDLLLSLALFAL